MILVARDNDWLAEYTRHPVTHLLAPANRMRYLQACGRIVPAEASMQQIAEWINAHVKKCINIKVAGPQHNRVGNLIPEDLYVQVGAR